jgi:hypothetical protein
VSILRVRNRAAFASSQYAVAEARNLERLSRLECSGLLRGHTAVAEAPVFGPALVLPELELANSG